MRTREELLPLARSNCEALVDIILTLQKHILMLEKRIKDLEARLAKNSRNSSNPPSSDGYIKPDPRSLRKPNGLESGGQEGHPGKTLSFVNNPDFTVVHRLGALCPCGCGKSLRQQPVIRVDKRQVFDLPPQQKLVVTEHHAEVKLCPNSGGEVTAPFPVGVLAPTQYGPRFSAWLVYLRGQQLIPLHRISQMSSDLYDRPVSEATVQSAVASASSALAGFQDKVADLIAESPVVHADETGLRVAGSLHWLHVASTKAFTWYGVHKNRGTDAIDHFAILPRFKGRLIHDCWSPYFKLLKCVHGLCNAHLLRELTFLHDVLGQRWAKRMLELLLRMHRSVASDRDVGSSASPRLAAWTWKYKALLREGFAENRERKTPVGPRPRGHPKRTKAQNLLFRLRLHERSVLAFLHDFRVPFSNNQAEQDLRMMRVQQKISGTFRTFEAARAFARIRAYLSTVRKNKRDVFQELVAALAGQPFMPSVAA